MSDVFTTGFDQWLRRLDTEFSESDEVDYTSLSEELIGILTDSGVITESTSATDITSGEIGSLIGYGKTTFIDTTDGWLQGLDSDNVFKWIIGTAGSQIDWSVTTPDTLTISGTLVASTLIGGEIHIPDQDTTTASFHTNSSGTSWWGATETDFNADNDNAEAYITAAGVAVFQSATIGGTSLVGGFTVNDSTIYALLSGTPDASPVDGLSFYSGSTARVVIFEDGDERVRLGYLSAGVYGLLGYASDGSTKLFELSDTQNMIAGWRIVDGYIYNLQSGTPTSTPNDGIVLASGNEGAIVYEDTAKRAELGYLSAGVYGLKVYATNGTTVIFEASDTQQIMAGWTFTDTSLYNLVSGTPTSTPSDGLVLTANATPAVIAYENTEKRAEMGYLSAGVFGFKGYADNGTTVIFEMSDTQKMIAGWVFDETYMYGLASGTPTSSPNDGVVLTSGSSGGLLVYEDLALRVRVGFLSSGIYGILGYATDGTTKIFEMSDTQQMLGGWFFTSTVLRSGATDAASNVLIDSANSLMRLGPTTGDYITMDGANLRIRSSNYVSGALGAGFTLEPDLLEVGNITARGLIRTAVFETVAISAVGGNLLVADADKLNADMTALDASTLTISGNTTFAVGDILRIKNGGSDDEWLEVTNIASAPTYTVTRDKAAAYAADTNPVWTNGASVVNYRASGDGLVYMTASDTNAPYIAILTHAGSPWSSTTTRARLGNLNGYLGYVADIYGLGVGSSDSGEANITIEPTNGIRIRSGTTVLFNVDMSGSATIGGWVLDADSLTDAAGVVGISSAVTGGDDIRFFAGDVTPASAEFRVYESGALVATSATITGAITATSGAIGGWTINATSITDAAGVVGMSSAVTGGDDIRFWAGDATPASAEFYVTEAGALTATSATITGVVTANTGYIGGTSGWVIAAGKITSTGIGVATSTGDATYAFWAGDDTPASAEFSVSHAGALVATSATITGAITATSGAIGGWDVVSGYIYNLQSGTPTSSPSDGVVLASGNEGLIIYEDTEKRIELGYLSAGVYGLKGYATNGSTVLFELSDTQAYISGWTIGATTLANGTNIILDASNKAISINDATFGNDGIQIQYNSGNPRMYVGDGADQFFEYDGATGTANNSGLLFQDAFGDGSDGDVVIGSNTTLTTDMYYDDLTVSNGFTLTTANYRVFVKGTLTNAGTIKNTGNVGTAGSPGSAGDGAAGGGAGGAGGAAIAAGFFAAGEDGKTGGYGSSSEDTNPTGGSNGDSVTLAMGASGVAGGDSNDITASPFRTGGTAGTATAPTNEIRSLAELIVFRDYTSSAPTKLNNSAGSGSGAGARGGDYSGSPASTAGAGGGGGGSGSTGGTMLISAAKIVNTGTISCAGGAGGAGGDGDDGDEAAANEGSGGNGGGGGGGGTGGVMILVYKTLSDSGTISVAGGAAGAGGDFGLKTTGGVSDGLAGNAGTAGNTGTKIQIPI